MRQVKNLPSDAYLQIVGVMPILCVDLVIRNSEGKYLLVKRNNEPLKGQWWVPGGRVFKGESLQEAAIRKAREELSLEISSLVPVGYQEYFLGEYHSVGFVFTGTVADEDVVLDSQSNAWGFFPTLPSGFIIVPFEKVGQC